MPLTTWNRAEIKVPDIAGAVAAMTEGDPGLRVKEPPTTLLVNWDPPSLRAMAGEASATRRARRLAVQLDVGELCFVLRSVRSREAGPALIKTLAR
jgi:hypothetical protein